MTIEIIKGDLFASAERVIAHGCNIRGVMGAGVAGIVARRWPELLHHYENQCRAGFFVAGSCQAFGVAFRGDGGTGPEIVVNLGTQDDPGPCARLYWIELAFANLAEWAARAGVRRVAIPKIGCGIGGLDWINVEKAIERGISDVNARGRDQLAGPSIQIVCYEL